MLTVRTTGCRSLLCRPRDLAHRCAQEYVRARLIQFAGPFARRMNPTLPLALIQQTAAETIAALPPPEYSGASVEHRDLQLVFRHDCL